MKLQSLHTHSHYDDGKSSLEEMVLSAMDHGLSAMGFSGHSPMPEPQGWTVQLEDLPRYKAEILALQEKYKDQIPLYYGLELDLVSQVPIDDYQYVIGSVHHIPYEGGWVSVDDSVACARNNVKNLFGGDSDAYSIEYYKQVERIAGIPQIKICAHFDQLTKFNEIEPLVNTDTLAYHRAADRAMEAVVTADKVFEINTGAISRGYRITPYPPLHMLKQLQRMGARITITADAHHASGIACGYADALERAKFCGFTDIWLFNGTEFIPHPIETIEI